MTTPREIEKASTAMAALTPRLREVVIQISRLVMAPHEGVYEEERGWRCRVCGAESMDVELLREVPCER